MSVSDIRYVLIGCFLISSILISDARNNKVDNSGEEEEQEEENTVVPNHSPEGSGKKVSKVGIIIDLTDDYEPTAKVGDEDKNGKKEKKDEKNMLLTEDDWEVILKQALRKLHAIDDLESKKTVIPYHAALSGNPPVEPAIESGLQDNVNEHHHAEDVDKTPVEIEAEKYYSEAMKELRKTRPNKADATASLSKAANLGHLQSQALVAWEELFGAYMPHNITNAKLTFQKLADVGVPDAHTGLGFMYAAGIGVNASQPIALVHYLLGALGGSTWAQMALGYRYHSGLTVKANCDSSLLFYREVASKVSKQVKLSGGPVVQRVRLLEADSSDFNGGILDQDLISYYQMMADKGDIQAQVGLGQLHYQGGRGVPLDPEKALRYFTNAANAGNAIATAFLGKMYFEGNDYVQQDNQTAFKYFTKAAESGNPVGQSGLGMMYLYGRGVPKDYKKAYQYFEKAAAQGWVDAQLYLGIMYYSGLDVPRNFQQANKYFTMASRSGHVLAYYNLAQMHAHGVGAPRSCTTAVELYKSVSERGRWSTYLMEAHSSFLKGDINQAFVKYAFLAELGYEVAQSNAAYILDTAGTTLWEDKSEKYKRAIMYWSRAAKQGYSSAEVKLGDYYYYGLGTNVDYETAALHYRVAYEHYNNAQAMFNLGYMHERGLGLAQDMYLAKRCYDAAAEISEDAKIPVALALIRLTLYFAFKYMREKKWFDIFWVMNISEILSTNWDLYAIAVLLVALTALLWRRPNGAEPEAVVPPASEHSAASPTDTSTPPAADTSAPPPADTSAPSSSQDSATPQEQAQE